MKLNSATAAVILLVAAACLTAVSMIVNTIDASTFPVGLNEAVQIVQYIFASSAIAPLWVFIRNAYGYWSKLPGNENIQYEAKQLWQTWLRYEEYIKGIGVLIVVLTKGTTLEPYAILIAGSAAFIADLILDALSDIAAKPTIEQ